MGNSQFFSKLTGFELQIPFCVRLSSLGQFHSHLWLPLALWGSGLFLANPTWANWSEAAPLNEADSFLWNQAEASQILTADLGHGGDIWDTIDPISSGMVGAGTLNFDLGAAESTNIQSSRSESGAGKLGRINTEVIAADGNNTLPNSLEGSVKPILKSDLLSTKNSHKAGDLESSEISTSTSHVVNWDSDQKNRTWAIAPIGIAPFQSIQANHQLLANSPEQSISDTGSPQPQPSLQPSTDPNRPSTVQPFVPACLEPDPDLGCVKLQTPWYATAKPPVLYLVPRVDFLTSNNALSGIDPIDDSLLRLSLQLLALPPLGKNTYLVASVEGSLNRYLKVIQFNYDELKFRAGLLHQLSPSMSAEVGWTNQQLFISGNDIPGISRGSRFLDDHTLRLEISRRDQLAKRLSLSSFYQFRYSFADPDIRSRFSNVVFLSLNYDWTPRLQTGLDFQFSSANYTKVPRTDLYYQVLGRLTYSAFQNGQINFYGGLSLGSSTQPGINFDSYILGVSISVNLPIF